MKRNLIRLSLTVALLCGNVSLAMNANAPDTENRGTEIVRAVILTENDRNAWFDAARSADIEQMRSLINRKIDVNCSDENGLTALIYAAILGHTEVVDLLMLPVPTGEQVLTWLLMGKNRIEVSNNNMNRLFLQGENLTVVDATDQQGKTAFIYAAAHGNIEILEMLLNNDADINSQDLYYGGIPRFINGGLVDELLVMNNRTALTYAAENGHESVVRFLLERGADPHLKDYQGKTAFIYAAKNGHEGVLRLLLERGVDINLRDLHFQTALMYAAENGHESVVRFLLERGADPRYRGLHDKIAFVYAAENGHVEVLRLLMNHDAGLNLLMDIEKQNLLIRSVENGHVEVLRLLMNYDAGLNLLMDVEKQSLLINAVKNGNTEILEVLLDNGASLDLLENYQKRDLLIYAVENKNAEMLRFLLRKGVDPNVRLWSNDNTVLMSAVECKNEEAVRLLLSYGADPNTGKGWGLSATALTLAAKADNEGIIRLLFDYGTDPYVRSRWSSDIIETRLKRSTWLNDKINRHRYNDIRRDVPILHDCREDVSNAITYFTVGDFENAPGLDNAYGFVRAGASGIRKVLDGSSIGLAPMAIPNIPAGTNIVHAVTVQLNKTSGTKYPMLFRPQWGFYGHWRANRHSIFRYQCPSVMRIYLGGIDNGKESRSNWLDVDFSAAPEVSSRVFSGNSLNEPSSHELPARVQNSNISYTVMHCTYYHYFNKVVYGTIIALPQNEFDAFCEVKNRGGMFAEGLRGIPLVRNSVVLQQILGLVESK